MPLAWRIVKEKQAATAFDGEGAFRFGGRWNSPRGRVVYTSATLSLAALETLVHLVAPVALKYTAFRLEFEDALVEEVNTSKLPADWRAGPPGPSTMAIGDDWLRRARTAILAVPSVIVPEERNYLLNPSHPDFAKISIGKPRPFAFDPRLLS